MINVTDIANMKDEEFTESAILSIAAQSAVFFLSIPDKLITESVLIKAIEIQPSISHIIPYSLITQTIIKKLGGLNMSLVYRVEKSLVTAQMSLNLMLENPHLFAFINHELIPDQVVNEALLAAPVNIVYVDSMRINESTCRNVDADLFIPSLDRMNSAQQFALCKIAPSLVIKCTQLSHEQLFALLPLIGSDDDKLHIMKTLGSI
jgi:hypothetical protein